MAISKRKGRDGKPRYTVAVNAPDPSTGQWKRFSVGTFDRKADAEDAERKAKLEVKNGTFVPPAAAKRMAATAEDAPKPETVADLVGLWFEIKKMDIEPNTASGYESAIRLHLVPALGSMAIADLTHDDVQRQVIAWRNAGMGAQLIHRCTFILRGALARAVMTGKLPYNPAEGIEKPSVKKRRQLTIWTPKQQGAFLTAGEDDELGVFWYLTLLEGMRRAEALGLRWADLEWSADKAHVTARVSQTVIPDLTNGGRPLVQQRTKTQAGARAIAFTKPTVEALKRHQTRQMFQREAAGEMWSEHGLIVTNALGEAVNPSAVKVHRKRLIEKAGVPEMTTHDLRHIAATVMLASGAPGATVSHKLGHSSFSTTADLYGHVMASDQAVANAAIEANFAKGTADTGS